MKLFKNMRKDFDSEEIFKRNVYHQIIDIIVYITFFITVCIAIYKNPKYEYFIGMIGIGFLMLYITINASFVYIRDMLRNGRL